MTDVPAWLVEEAEQDMDRAAQTSWALEIPFQQATRRPYVIAHPGGYVESRNPWRDARETLGLKQADYGRTWWVYESMNDYLASRR